MRTLKNFLLFAFVGLMASNAFAQGTVKGTVVEAGTNEALPGAEIVVVGTQKGTATDFDGNFVLEVPAGPQKLKVSFVGYESNVIDINVSNGQTLDLGTIVLKPSANSLDEIVIVGVADIAKERQTPVAVSTMKAAEIQERIGTKELPEVLNYTPSVYATKRGGGFGDARINVRGFDQRNTAVMINGMPVNDMENGWVYWSNWAGLADVTSAMQVQRGLGSSKLAIPSVGGTINILTNSANKKKGGAISATFGNDNFMKFSAAYNTGLLDNGLSASVLLSRFSGDGYVDGTQGEGYTWFLSIGYKINDKHNVMFTSTGAPQWHHQRYDPQRLDWYLTYGGNANEPNIKYNSFWGYLDGEVYSARRNFYHKPIASLNWDWKINDNMKFMSVFYGSWGRGGGTGPIGGINGKWLDLGRSSNAVLYNEDGLIRWDDIATWNAGGHVADFGADRTPDGDGLYTNARRDGISRRASMNSHDWYGTVMNFHDDVNENLSFDIGVDWRTYTGYHYRVVNDVLGADRYYDNRDRNNPDRYIYPEDFVEATPSWNPFIDIKGQEKIEYYNQGNVKWLGGFAQVEYKTEQLSAFVQGGYSNQQFQRIDYFNLPRDVDGDGVEEPQESDWVSLNGGNIKGGVNYNLNEKHNVFVNAGYYSKQPLFRAVFPNYTDNNVTENLTNEDVMAFEGGYGFKGEHWRLNVNLYNTTWKNRFKVAKVKLDTDNDGSGDTKASGRLFGITEVHKGVEIESSAKYGNLKLFGMISAGNWEYSGDIKGVKFYDDNQDLVQFYEDGVLRDSKDYYLDGVKVGDAAQFTSRLGFTYEVLQGLKFSMDQFYVNNLYAKIDATSFDQKDNDGSLKLPAYSLVDANISYKFNVKKVGKITTRFTINNLFNKIYISESATNFHAKDGDKTWNGINVNNDVFFGYGRTWNFSVKLNF